MKNWQSYHVVCGCLWVFMSEVKRIDSERLLELIFILYPEKTKYINDPQASVPLTFNLLFFNVRPSFMDNISFYSGEKRLSCICSPESCAVKTDHQPLGRVEDKRVSIFNALQGPAELRTDVGWASVCCINMEPHSLFCTCKTSRVIILMQCSMEQHNVYTTQAVLKQTVAVINLKTYRLVPVQIDCRRHTLL